MQLLFEHLDIAMLHIAVRKCNCQHLKSYAVSLDILRHMPEITPVVIQVETPGTAQVELPVVPPEAEQPSRFFFAVLSGVVFFAAYAPVTIGNKMIDALIYSVTYNGSYLAVEEIITIIVISIPPVKKALDYVKQMANSR